MHALMNDGLANIEHLRSRALFRHSLNPMVIADDERRYVDANAAACLFLRASQEEICKLRVDDLTAPELLPSLEAVWAEFLQGKFLGQSVPWDLRLPDGTSVQVDTGSIPHVEPGRNLAVWVFPAARALNERLGHARAPANVVLTKREREILTLVALGNTGIQIAGELFLSPATVQTHVANALIKLGAKNRAHGITLALTAGELDLDHALDHVRGSSTHDQSRT
ncbi:MAG TPA: LuxR C-terminal-related transcriptional regulator [Solirubrobacteraceae bacterium]|nr:LuxR C-terminal-related transcriptional regulator [Solirubrobacteraceae bacterium]